MNIDKLNEQYQKLYQELENNNYQAEQDFYDLEQQVSEELSCAFACYYNDRVFLETSQERKNKS